MTADDATTAGVVLDLPEAGTGTRARRRRRERRRARFRRGVFAVVLTLLCLAVPVLSFVGFRAVVDSRSGRLVAQERDPSAPGYEAVVERTPTALFVQTGADGALVSLTLLALAPGDAGGAMLFIPVNTIIDAPDGTVATLAAVYKADGLDAVRDATALTVGVGFDETVPLTSSRWAEVVGPVAPLTVDNPDDVVALNASGKPETLFAAGPVALGPDDVGPYLATLSPSESDLARLVRQQVFWEVWLAAIKASSDPAVVPGETTTGLGRFVRSLAAGTVRYETLPVSAAPPGAGDGELFQAQPAAVNSVVAQLVPFPVSPVPGKRPRVSLLDGRPDTATRDLAAHVLVQAGAEIDTIGNADHFGYRTTSIVYYAPERQADAENLRDALGVGKITFKQADSDQTDVTIVLGADYNAGAGSPDTTTTTGDGSSG